MNNKKKDILIIMGRYLPGYKDGGPVRTIKNLIDFLGDEYNFKILTCDRDHGDEKAYPNICVNGWNRVGKAYVYYVKPKGFSYKVIKELVEIVDLIYVCGCFSDYAITTLVANRLRKFKVPVIVAAMGLFMPNAMKKKPLKYHTFLKMFYFLGMFKNISWSATSQLEEDCIHKYVDSKAKCFIAQDLPRIVSAERIEKAKKVGELKVFFISRISPEKNLYGAIKCLKNCKSNITFSIFGPIYDSEYWKKCQKELAELPINISAEYKGIIESDKVVEILKQEHVFLFMTMAENYGHVIQEALSAGCPCLISDQTPWAGLEENSAGYVIPLENEQDYSEAIDFYASLSELQFQKYVDSAHTFALEKSRESIKGTGYRRIFQ